MWSIPQAACFVWIGIEYGKFGLSKPALDYETYVHPSTFQSFNLLSSQ